MTITYKKNMSQLTPPYEESAISDYRSVSNITDCGFISPLASPNLAANMDTWDAHTSVGTLNSLHRPHTQHASGKFVGLHMTARPKIPQGQSTSSPSTRGNTPARISMVGQDTTPDHPESESESVSQPALVQPHTATSHNSTEFVTPFSPQGQANIWAIRKLPSKQNSAEFKRLREPLTPTTPAIFCQADMLRAILAQKIEENERFGVPPEGIITSLQSQFHGDEVWEAALKCTYYEEDYKQDVVLVECAKRNLYHMLEEIIVKVGAAPKVLEMPGRYGRTALQYAAREGNWKATSMLIRHRANCGLDGDSLGLIKTLFRSARSQRSRGGSWRNLDKDLFEVFHILEFVYGKNWASNAVSVPSAASDQKIDGSPKARNNKRCYHSETMPSHVGIDGLSRFERSTTGDNLSAKKTCDHSSNDEASDDMQMQQSDQKARFAKRASDLSTVGSLTDETAETFKQIRETMDSLHQEEPPTPGFLGVGGRKSFADPFVHRPS